MESPITKEQRKPEGFKSPPKRQTVPVQTNNLLTAIRQARTQATEFNPD